MPDFLEILGQDAALAQLQRALAGQRRPHAYIFAGPEGVGRRTTAAEFAKLLWCEKPLRRRNGDRLAGLPEDFSLRTACGRCNSCRTAAAGTNPDLLLVYKELARYHDDPDVRDRVMQELGIEVIRQFLIDPAYRASAGGRGKVFLVLQAERMSDPAQNALLKTLEEPPPGVTIILLSPGPSDLLPTTRSRCQVIRFGPLPAALVAERLTAQGTGQDEARFWAAFTAGSLGRAIRLAAAGLYQFKRQLVAQLAGLRPGGEAPLAGMLTETMETRAKARQKADPDLAATLASRQAGEVILDLIASVYRDALSVACSARRVLVHADQAEAVGGIAAHFGPQALSEILEQLARYEQLLWRNVHAKLLWDNVAVTCAAGTPLAV